MATLYLHIGTPKTGTTAIQQLLAQNSKVFEEHGICCPTFPFRYPRVRPDRTGHFLVAQQPDDLKAGLETVFQCARKFDKILLSDESIWQMGYYIPSFWSDLKARLAEHGIDLRVIVYLRRQDQFILSLYAQKVAHRGMSMDFEQFLDMRLHCEQPYLLDYCTGIDRLAETVGRDSLFIRVYEKGQFQGGDGTLFSDFLDIFGLSMSDGFSTQRTFYNTRLNGNDLELTRILNVLPYHDGNTKGLLANTMREIQKLGDRYPDNSVRYGYFEPQAQKEFLDAFADSNSRLARRYLNREDGVLFAEPFEPLPAASVGSKAFVQNMALVYGKAIETLELRNAELEKQQKQFRKEIRELKNSRILPRIKRKLSRLFHLQYDNTTAKSPQTPERNQA